MYNLFFPSRIYAPRARILVLFTHSSQVPTTMLGIYGGSVNIWYKLFAAIIYFCRSILHIFIFDMEKHIKTRIKKSSYNKNKHNYEKQTPNFS